MSLRVDTSEWIAGSLLIGETGLGVIGSAIPSTGDNGPAYTYNDLSFPTDNNKEVCGRITSWPSAGTLVAYEDTSFEFTGAPDGAYFFDYQLYVDGVATGSPVTVSLAVGVITHATTGYLVADSASVSGTADKSASVVTHISSGSLVAGSATLLGTATNSTPTIGRPDVDVSNAGWTPSSGSDLFAMLDEVTPSDLDYISTSAVGSTCSVGLNTTQYPGSVSQQLSLRASSSTGNGLSVTIKDGATTIATRSLTLTPTYDLYTITLTAGEIAAITSGNLTVEMTST